MKPSDDDQPLHELKHEAEPGYMKAFLIAFVAMTAYLAWIIVSSPGKVEYHKDKGGHEEQEAPAKGH